MSPTLWFFRDLQLNERLPAPVLETLKTKGRLERWGHNAQIFHDEDDGRVYMVLGGGVFIHDGTSAQRVKLRPGDAFGVLSTHSAPEILPAGADPRLRRHLEAFDDTLLVSVERDVFQDLIQPHLGLIEASIGRLRQKRTYRVPISPLLYTTPTSRFARTMLHLIESQGRVEGDRGELEFPFEPHQIAPLLGVDKPRSQAVAEALMRRGVIQNEPTRILTPSLEELKRFALGLDP